MNTQLMNRVLWYDGSITVNPEDLMNIVLKSRIKGHLYTTAITNEITDYNRLVKSNEKISIKESCTEFDTSWNIPSEYKQINIKHHLINKIRVELQEFELSDVELKARIVRIDRELQVYIKLNLYELLQTLVYIVDVFNRENVVWGVGRGSSVSSYILYLIGIHDIDSVLYDLDFSEFLTGE